MQHWWGCRRVRAKCLWLVWGEVTTKLTVTIHLPDSIAYEISDTFLTFEPAHQRYTLVDDQYVVTILS